MAVATTTIATAALVATIPTHRRSRATTGILPVLKTIREPGRQSPDSQALSQASMISLTEPQSLQPLPQRQVGLLQSRTELTNHQQPQQL